MPPAVVASLSALRLRAERLRAHRFWIECAALTGLGLLAAGVLGSTSLARAAELEEEAARLERVRSAMDLWVRELQPPTPAESSAWRESEQRILAVDGSGLDPLSVAGRLTQRAEEVGVDGLRVRLVDADSASPPPAQEGPGWVVDTGPIALAAEFSGDWASVLGFVGALPPEVQVGSLELSSGEGGLHARLVLFTREASSLP